MHVELTFSNDSDAKIEEKRTIYMALDDAKGQNHMRKTVAACGFHETRAGEADGV